MASFLSTLKTVTIEHFIGRSVTNNDHSHSPVLLFKLVKYYVQILESDDVDFLGELFF